MKAVIFVLVIIFYTGTVYSQVGIAFDTNSPGVGGYGNVSYTNASTIGIKTTQDINDADVADSPYFDEKWNRAVVILQNNQGIKIKKVKLNLFKSEMHYLDSTGNELVAVAGTVKKIFFLDNKDTSKITSVFQQISGVEGKANTQFIQVLNSGKVELLKLTQVVINDRGFDPTTGKNNYNFVPKASYYLLNGNAVMPLKLLDKDDVLAVLSPSAAAGNWLNENKNKLRNEGDVISFLNYYNGAN